LIDSSEKGNFFELNNTYSSTLLFVEKQGCNSVKASVIALYG